MKNRYRPALIKTGSWKKLKPDNCVYINNDQSIEDTIGQLMVLVEISNI